MWSPHSCPLPLPLILISPTSEAGGVLAEQDRVARSLRFLQGAGGRIRGPHPFPFKNSSNLGCCYEFRTESANTFHREEIRVSLLASLGSSVLPRLPSPSESRRRDRWAKSKGVRGGRVPVRCWNSELLADRPAPCFLRLGCRTSRSGFVRTPVIPRANFFITSNWCLPSQTSNSPCPRIEI